MYLWLRDSTASGDVQLKMRHLGILLAACFTCVASACTYTARGEAPSAAASIDDQPIWSGGIVGLEKFETNVPMVTFAGSAQKFKISFSAGAGKRLSAAMLNAGYPPPGG